ncbi:MAG: YdcH family protein [Acidobacteria bacterium]|nr:YdcH family protein [Acidobacteriota bacterium]
MEANAVEIRERLARESEEFRTLREQHRDFEARLEILQQKTCLSEAERTEEKVLKKRKLALKDRMEKMVRSRQAGFRDGTAGN